MPYCDLRLGGISRQLLAGFPLMLVPPEIRECVAFVGFRDPSGQPVLKGTGFFVASDLSDLGLSGRGAVYFVTAQHVVDGIRTNGGRGVVRINVSGQGARWFEIPADQFLSHPLHPHTEVVDVAVVPVGLPEIVQFMAIPLMMFANTEVLSKHRIGVGDEVFLSGLFWNHHGRERNLPIVRIGNIAAMPEEKVQSRIGDIEAYLIEARSIGGLSGSPVFVHLGATRIIDGKVMLAQNTDHGIFFLLGVMQGHWDSNSLLTVDELSIEDSRQQERVNMGIAVVTPIQKVMDILNTDAAQRHRQAVALATREALRAEMPIEDARPSSDSS
jgi:hypothetical protein